MWVTDDLGQVHLPSTHHQTKPMVADTVCVCVCVCSHTTDVDEHAHTHENERKGEEVQIEEGRRIKKSV